MDFKILLLVLCITFVSVQGAIPRCCVATAPIQRTLLKRAKNFIIQDRRGRCEIDALVVKVGKKTLCAPLRQKIYLEKMKTLTGKKSF